MAGKQQRGRFERTVDEIRVPAQRKLTVDRRTRGPVTLGEYVLLCRIGEGGMCRVYKAYDLRDGREVALKILRTRFARHLDEQSRFFQEATVLRRLQHPNIVQAYCGGRRGRHCYLAVEYVEGASAGEALQRGEIPLDELMRMAIEVLRALDHAHGRGVLHCDVKPDNILIRRRDASVKLADFGLALWLHRSRTRESGPEHRFTYGTLQYMPPEQIADMSSVDERSDLYAFGATLFQLLTGRFPFPGRSLEQIVRRKQAGSAAPVHGWRPEVPAELEQLLDALMAPSPGARPASAAEVLQIIDRLDLACERISWMAGREPQAAVRSDADATAWEVSVSEVLSKTEWFVQVETGEMVPVGGAERLEWLVRERRIGLDTLVARGRADAVPLPLRAYDRFQHLLYDPRNQLLADRPPEPSPSLGWL